MATRRRCRDEAEARIVAYSEYDRMDDDLDPAEYRRRGKWSAFSNCVMYTVGPWESCFPLRFDAGERRDSLMVTEVKVTVVVRL